MSEGEFCGQRKLKNFPGVYIVEWTLKLFPSPGRVIFFPIFYA